MFENSTSPRSIIFFRPGTAGDFLKSLCMGQLQGTPLSLSNDGRVFVRNDFKLRAFKIKPWWADPSVFDDELVVDEVENTGYVDQPFKLAWNKSKWFYTRVPHNHLRTVMHAALIKCGLYTIADARSLADRDLLDYEHEYGEIDNTDDMISLFTISLIKSYDTFYSSELHIDMTPIDVIDIFDPIKCSAIVEDLIQEKLPNAPLFFQQHDQWLQLNQWYLKMLSDERFSATSNIDEILSSIRFVKQAE